MRAFERRDFVVLLLSIAGGGVDAIIVLGFHVLTAAQTGNTILLAVAFAERRFATALYAAVSVVTYLIGSALGELIIDARRAVAWALIAEILLIAALLVLWHVSPAAIGVLVAIAAIAMGMQSAAVLRLSAGPMTTYMTGTLTEFATEAARSLRWVRRGERPAIYGIDWAVYFGGALANGLLFLHFRENALLLPIAAVTAGAVLERYTR